jgi:protease-4
VDIKVLLGILNRPWMLEPTAAEYWATIARDIIDGRLMGVPSADNRKYYGGDFFRVDQNGNMDKSGPVQVMNVMGPIGKYDFCGWAGSQSMQQGIRAANQDQTVESIVLWIDSPGGQVDGTANLASEIKASTKPVVAFADGMMASAAYWIGSSADEIVVDKANNGFNTLIGSIGTMAMWMDNSKENETKGIKVHTVYATKSTDKGKLMEEANQGNYAGITKMLDNLNETFLSAVKVNRAGKIDLGSENVLTGKTYEGKDAIKYGLADRMGDFQIAVKRSLQLAKTIRA